jgi:hypothetical protein
MRKAPAVRSHTSPRYYGNGDLDVRRLRRDQPHAPQPLKHVVPIRKVPAVVSQTSPRCYMNLAEKSK